MEQSNPKRFTSKKDSKRARAYLFYNLKLIVAGQDHQYAKFRKNVFEDKIDTVNQLYKQRLNTLKVESKGLQKLNGDIVDQINQVKQNILGLNDTAVYWDFSNRMARSVLDLSRNSYVSNHLRWINAWPVLQLWMVSESKAHHGIFHNAALEGITEQLLSHLETRLSLKSYFQESFHDYSDEQLKSTNELTSHQLTLSANFDELLDGFKKRYNTLRDSCESIMNDIAEREELRLKLNDYIMEYSNALDEDLKESEQIAEEIAVKPTGQVMNDLRLHLSKLRHKNESKRKRHHHQPFPKTEYLAFSNEPVHPATETIPIQSLEKKLPARNEIGVATTTALQIIGGDLTATTTAAAMAATAAASTGVTPSPLCDPSYDIDMKEFVGIVLQAMGTNHFHHSITSVDTHRSPTDTILTDVLPESSLNPERSIAQADPNPSKTSEKMPLEEIFQGLSDELSRRYQKLVTGNQYSTNDHQNRRPVKDGRVDTGFKEKNGSEVRSDGVDETVERTAEPSSGMQSIGKDDHPTADDNKSALIEEQLDSSQYSEFASVDKPDGLLQVLEENSSSSSVQQQQPEDRMPVDQFASSRVSQEEEYNEINPLQQFQSYIRQFDRKGLARCQSGHWYRSFASQIVQDISRTYPIHEGIVPSRSPSKKFLATKLSSLMQSLQLHQQYTSVSSITTTPVYLGKTDLSFLCGMASRHSLRQMQLAAGVVSKTTAMKLLKIIELNHRISLNHAHQTQSGEGDERFSALSKELIMLEQQQKIAEQAAAEIVEDMVMVVREARRVVDDWILRANVNNYKTAKESVEDVVLTLNLSPNVPSIYTSPGRRKKESKSSPDSNDGMATGQSFLDPTSHSAHGSNQDGENHPSEGGQYDNHTYKKILKQLQDAATGKKRVSRQSKGNESDENDSSDDVIVDSKPFISSSHPEVPMSNLIEINQFLISSINRTLELANGPATPIPQRMGLLEDFDDVDELYNSYDDDPTLRNAIYPHQKPSPGQDPASQIHNIQPFNDYSQGVKVRRSFTSLPNTQPTHPNFIPHPPTGPASKGEDPLTTYRKSSMTTQTNFTGFPEVDTVLKSLETIIHGELYQIDFEWIVEHKVIVLIAKTFQKKKFYEFRMILNSHIIREVTRTPKRLNRNLIFSTNSKLFAMVVDSLSISLIDPIYYEDIVQRRSYLYDVNTPSSYGSSPQSLFDIDKMINKSPIIPPPLSNHSPKSNTDVMKSPRSSLLHPKTGNNDSIPPSSDISPPTSKDISPYQSPSPRSSHRKRLTTHDPSFLNTPPPSSSGRSMKPKSPRGVRTVKSINNANDPTNGVKKGVRMVNNFHHYSQRLEERKSQISSSPHLMATDSPREFEYLLNVLTIRSKGGDLMGYSFPKLVESNDHPLPPPSIPLSNSNAKGKS